MLANLVAIFSILTNIRLIPPSTPCTKQATFCTPSNRHGLAKFTELRHHAWVLVSSSGSVTNDSLWSRGAFRGPTTREAKLLASRALALARPPLFDASYVYHRVAAIIPGQWAIETKPSIALHVIFHCPTRRGRRGVASRSQHRCHRKYPNRWWADIPPPHDLLASRIASFISYIN